PRAAVSAALRGRALALPGRRRRARGGGPALHGAPVPELQRGAGGPGPRAVPRARRERAPAGRPRPRARRHARPPRAARLAADRARARAERDRSRRPRRRARSPRALPREAARRGRHERRALGLRRGRRSLPEVARWSNTMTASWTIRLLSL